MQTPQNKPSFSQRLKDMKISRSGLLTAIVLLVTLTVIISVTVATNRSRKPGDETTSAGDVTTTNRPTQTTEPTTESTTVPEQPTGTGSAPVQNKIPSLILPVNGVLSQKHDPEVQVFSTTMNDYRVHIGIDIGTEEGAPVYAAADGTVSKIWNDVRMGQCIAIQHSGDCVTVYKNLSTTIAEGLTEGAKVRSGQLLATVGDSAMIEVAEEPHLHFEVTVDNLSVDPLEYFDEKALESLSIDASHGE